MAAQSLVFNHILFHFKQCRQAFGTINLLEILRNIQFKCTVLIINSDKVYKNVEKIPLF